MRRYGAPGRASTWRRARQDRRERCAAASRGNGIIRKGLSPPRKAQMTPRNAKHFYVYVADMQIAKAIAVHDGMVLLPASTPSTLTGSLHSIRDLTQLGMASLYLPLVTAQIKIRYLHQDDIPVLTSRALRTILLLGALFDRHVATPLMGFKPMEEMCSAGDVRVAINHLFPLPKDSKGPLSPSEAAWVETHGTGMNVLLSGSMAFNTSVHCLATHAWHTAPRAQFALIWAGIEALFYQRKGNTPHIAHLASLFLHPKDAAQRCETESAARLLYAHRSSAVHGNELDTETHQHIPASADLLRKLLFRCIETGNLPGSTHPTNRC